MKFKSVFIAIFVSTSLILAALLIQSKRPMVDLAQPSADFVRATGKCAECHRQETSSIIHQFEISRHAQVGLNCLDCHQSLDGQEKQNHRGFVISGKVTSNNCRVCHSTQYDQFVRSRHGAPAWAAVYGRQDFTAEQILQSEKFHRAAVDREANQLAILEGESAMKVGCAACHDIGRPNRDGTIGDCTKCHARHSSSIALARQPETCGQCHMGPDHSQLEIYNESKHGILFRAQKLNMNLNADPKKLTTKDMPVPTCATCHMSGLEGQKFTHDVTERLSYWLFAAKSEKRPTYEQGQIEMKETCLKCHTKPHVENFYANAEAAVEATNEKVIKAKKIIEDLRRENLLTPEPFDEPIEFIYFDYWHYYGRTAKHGAFMGGADFVQWHGNYELLHKLAELKQMAKEIRAKHEK